MWVSRNVEGVDEAMICGTETWDKAGVRLSDAATHSDPMAKGFLHRSPPMVGAPEIDLPFRHQTSEPEEGARLATPRSTRCLAYDLQRIRVGGGL